MNENFCERKGDGQRNLTPLCTCLSGGSSSQHSSGNYTCQPTDYWPTWLTRAM